MAKSTLYLTTKVLPGNKIEIQDTSLSVGETVEVVILISQSTSNSVEERDFSLEQRLAFLKLPIAERRRILKSQAQTMLAHYQQDSEWKNLMSGDIIDY